MTGFGTLLILFIRSRPGAFWAGLALSFVALLAGTALLGLSGWFITASALAGVAGTGLVFDFFRPSAGIRFLAIARTAARYGERLTTHDATLKFLAAMRVRLLIGFARQPFASMMRLRGAVSLSRLTADIDALDQLYVRVLAPLVALGLSLGMAGVLIGWLASPALALLVVGVVAGTGLVMMGMAARGGDGPARRFGLGLEAQRLRLVDLRIGLVDLAMAGALPAQIEAVRRAGAYTAAARARLERTSHRVALLGGLATAGAAAGSIMLAADHTVPVALAAIAVFVSLGLGEGLMAWQRGVIELGRARLALRRMDLSAGPSDQERGAANEPSCSGHPQSLDFDRVGLIRQAARAPVIEDFSLSLKAGEWVVLTGPSGSGKSTLLGLAAGVEKPTAGAVRIGGVGVDRFDEAGLRARIAVFSQHTQLMRGTIADNLRLACPDADDDQLWDALRCVCLDEVVAARGGLGAALGEGGTGLSGGEMRRLCLARIVLRDTLLILLDEPTAGLDDALAGRVMANLRARWTQKIVLMAAHARVEQSVADRSVQLG